MKTICFTGPRKIYGSYSGSEHTRIYHKLIEVVKRAYKGGFNHFISGAALGIDTLAAEAVLYSIQSLWLPIKLTVALSQKDHGSNWPRPSQQRLRSICHRTAATKGEIITVSAGPFHNGVGNIRNYWMIDRSDAVIAVWENPKKGGTKHAVEYAFKKGLPILLIDPITLNEIWKQQLNLNKGARH